MPYSAIQTSFAGGEICPELYQRVDLAKYSVSAKTIKNMQVLPQGGALSRTGTLHANEIKNSAHEAKLIEFVFSTTQAYVLEFGDHYIRPYIKVGGVYGPIIRTTGDTSDYAAGTTYAIADFVKSGGIIYRSLQNSNTGHTPASSPTYWIADDTYEIYSPYGIADVWALNTEQSADTLFIAHPSYQPRKLTRTQHYAWTMSLFDFAGGPLTNENTTDISIKINGTIGVDLEKNSSVTLTSDANVFLAGHVGTFFGIRYTSGNKTHKFNPPDTGTWTSDSFSVVGKWTVTIIPDATYEIDTSDLILEKSIDDGTSWFQIKVWPATVSEAEMVTSGSEEEKCLMRFSRPVAPTNNDRCEITMEVIGFEQYAYVKITAITNAKNVAGTLTTDYYRTGIYLKTWSEGAWSDVRGWPSAVSFYQNRLIFGNNPVEPYAYWTSKTDDYENMEKSIPQVADDAISDRLLGRTVNAIKFFVPMQELLVFTTDGEWTVSPGNDGVLTYNSRKNKQQTYWGCADVRPVVVGSTVMFAQRGAAKVLGYSYDTDGYKYAENDLSIMAKHLFDGYQIVDWAYQQTPYSILWVVRSDGALLSFTFHREHEVWAWCRHETDGEFESVAVIPGGTQDDVLFIVKRTIGATTKRFVEVMAQRDISSKANFYGVDCGVTYSGTAISTLTGLSHLEGETVTVFADGKLYTKVVASGQITLNTAASVVHAGLPFEYQLDPIRADINNSADKKKLINSVTICVKDSCGGQIGVTGHNFVDIRYNTTTALTTAEIDTGILSGWNKDGAFTIKGNGAQPMHITALIPQITLGGK